LAGGAVERQDEQAPQLLAQRMGPHELLELGDRLSALAAVEPDLPQPLDGPHPQLLEPGRLGLEGGTAEDRVRRPPPQRQRGRQHRDGITCDVGHLGQQPDELLGVDPARRHVEGVAPGVRPGAPGPASAPRGTARARDAAARRTTAARPRPARRAIAPDLVDEVLDRDRTSGRRDEPTDQGPGLAPAEVEDGTVALDLEQSQHPDPHAARPS
jgi:hypothetical protein